VVRQQTHTQQLILSISAHARWRLGGLPVNPHAAAHPVLRKPQPLPVADMLLEPKYLTLNLYTTLNPEPDHAPPLQVVLKFQNGAAVVPLRELRVTESSESVLAGTKRPPFRLVVRAIKPDGRRLNIRPAVSEEFVVSIQPA